MDKRHFTVVIGSKEHGLYISSKPSSAAKKAVSKLCASNKSKKVEFCLREITQGSKKKTYGPYLGEMKKLKKPIELKGRVIRHEIKVHLKKGKRSTIKTAKKMRGGGPNLNLHQGVPNLNQIMDSDQRNIFINSAIEMNNFQGIFNVIFNGNIDIHEIIRLAQNNPEFIKRMINWINLSTSNEDKNKYFFIICYIISFEHRNNTILEHLISVIGIDRFIEIVFQINYGDEFNRIITNTGTNIERMSDIKINLVKSLLFMKLIKYYSDKMSLDDFKELLKKLFSIQNNSFIEFIFRELFVYFTKEYFRTQPSFKLFDFLFENKQELLSFIRIFKKHLKGEEKRRPLYITPQIRNIIGTEEIQTDLFRNV